MERPNPIIIDRATPYYRALMLELERRRQQLGWSMWQVDDAAGLQDGHYAKLLHADRPSGRQGTWASLHLVISALFLAGFDLVLKPKAGGVLTAESQALKIRFAQADNNRQTRRELMRELGKRGAAAPEAQAHQAGAQKDRPNGVKSCSHQALERSCGTGTSRLSDVVTLARYICAVAYRVSNPDNRS